VSYPTGDWTPLAVDASSRKYFKGTWEGQPALLADFGEDADGLARFVAVRGLFAGAAVTVPAIFHAEPGQGWVVQEHVKGWPLSKARWTTGVQDRLSDIADRIAAVTSWPEGPELLELDASRLRFELAFFKLHFVEGYMNAGSAPELAEALDALADEVASYPRAMAHRDFHSENVLGTSGEGLVVIDFQDALLAPRAYDMASLAVDPYRSQDPRVAEHFRRTWLTRSGAQPEEFDRTALQRALKALGTFGYQVTRRKRARYMRFVAPQARRAQELLAAAPSSLACLGTLLSEASA
jgi:N-acetylmuramate 1-kinase